MVQSLSFNSQPPEGGWRIITPTQGSSKWFQLTAARRRLGFNKLFILFPLLFQLTAARRRLAVTAVMPIFRSFVSTHSRPKAAGVIWYNSVIPKTSFNSQPPEGGWLNHDLAPSLGWCFNSQPPEGGWHKQRGGQIATHSFNSQPPEGGWVKPYPMLFLHFQFQLTAARRRLGKRVTAAEAE